MSNASQLLRLSDFRLIRAIRETGQLALAADLLAMTQPAASRTLAAIEARLGAPLFVRHPKGMTPTPVGEVVARDAASMLEGLEHTLEEVEAIIAGRAGTVRVGAVTGAAVAFVVPAIQQLKKTTAGADIRVDVAPSDVLIPGLIAGDYDFVLSRIPPGVDARQFTIRRGRVEVIHFLARMGHPAAGRGPVDFQDLADYEWVIQAPHTPMRHAVEEAFVTAGVPLPREIVNTTSLLVMVAYLLSSDAISPISREVADLFEEGTFRGRLVPLEPREQIIINPYHLIARRDHVMSPLALRLRDLVFEGLSAHQDAAATTLD